MAYEFDIIDILKKHKELTINQLLIEMKFKYGYGNRDRLVKVVRRLRDKDVLSFDVRTQENRRGRYFYYSLK